MSHTRTVALLLASLGLCSTSVAQLQRDLSTQPPLKPITVTPLPGTLPEGPVTPAVPAGPVGVLKLDTTRLDLGIIDDSGKVTRDVNFSNTGEAPLTITRLQAHCGCTVPDLEKTVYAPGESGTVKITYDPTGKHEGPQVTSVDFYTDNPSQPRIAMQIVSHILPLVSAAPTFVSFMNVDKGAVMSQPITIRGRMEGFKITSATANAGEGITVEVIDSTVVTDDKGETYTEVFALITLDGTRAPGRIAGNVTLFTNDERRATQAISVTGMVLGDVRSNMTQWRLGNAMTPMTTFTRTVRLTHRLGHEFRVVDVQEKQSTPNDQNITWTIAQPYPDRPDVVDVKLSLIANGKAGTQVGEVKILTDVKGEPSVSVTYFGNVRVLGELPATPTTAPTAAPTPAQPKPAPTLPDGDR